MTFLEAVNEIFRRNGILRGDTDAITSFSDVAHNASIQIAILSLQDEIADLISDRLIDNEKASSSITLVSGQRTYSLASNFVRFYGVANFYLSDQNRRVFEYPGGQEKLLLEIYDYQTQTGQMNWWYWEPTTSKKVGVFQVPTAAEDGQVWTYDYQKTVQVTIASDDLPLHSDDENRALVSMATRRFKYLFEDTQNAADIQAILEKDRGYNNAKVRLMNLIRPTKPKDWYGAVYL